MNDAPERPIVIQPEGGEPFEFDPPDDLWLDMLAFCEASGITIEELIRRALAEFFEAKDAR